MYWLFIFIFIFVYLNILLLLFSQFSISECENIKLKFFDVSFYFKDFSVLMSLAFMTFRSYKLLAMSEDTILSLVNAQDLMKSKSFIIIKYSFLSVINMFTSMQIKVITRETLLLASISIFAFLYILKYVYRKVWSMLFVLLTTIVYTYAIIKLPYTSTIVLTSCFIQSSVFTVLCCFMLSKMIQMLDLLWSTVSSFLYIRKDD